MTMKTEVETVSITMSAIVKAMRLMGCVDIPEDAKAIFAKEDNGRVIVHYLTETPKIERREGNPYYCVISLYEENIQPEMFTFDRKKWDEAQGKA